MRRLGLLVMILAFVAAATLSTAGASVQATTTICHRTASKTTPYVRLRVSGNVLRTHGKHAADIIPAPAGGCPKTLLTATSGGRAFQVALTGETESPAGDPVGTGTATIRLRAGQGQVCYTFDVQNITLPSVGAHIHRGAAGTSGPIVVGLVAPGVAGTSDN